MVVVLGLYVALKEDPYLGFDECQVLACVAATTDYFVCSWFFVIDNHFKFVFIVHCMMCLLILLNFVRLKYSLRLDSIAACLKRRQRVLRDVVLVLLPMSNFTIFSFINFASGLRGFV